MTLVDSRTVTQITEWDRDTWLLHEVTADYYQLFDPDNRDFIPTSFLAEHGIDGTWTGEQDTVGDVTVTHLRR